MDHTGCRTEERRRVGRRRLGLLAGLVLGAVLGAACSAPGEPIVRHDVRCPEAQVLLCTDPAAKSVAQDVASDGRTRSTLALENAAARQALTESLVQLNTQLGAGNITQARIELKASRDAVATARTQLTTFAGDAADLGAIELLLDYVASLVGS